MQIEIIFQSHHEKLERFDKETIKTVWETMIFVEEGEYALTVPGGRKTVLRKNEIGFIPGNVEFERRVQSAVTYYNVCFTTVGDHPFYSAAPTGKFKLPQKQVEAIIESMHRASLLPENREVIAHLVEHAFSENYLFGNTVKDVFKPLSEQIENAISYMKKNLDKKIDMDELAERVYLSHTGLIWKFRQELNTTPSNYLYLLRMRNARFLLLDHSYSVSEISEMCGYQNPYYFTNAFRKYSGMSPTKFRNHYLKEKR